MEFIHPTFKSLKLGQIGNSIKIIQQDISKEPKHNTHILIYRFSEVMEKIKIDFKIDFCSEAGPICNKMEDRVKLKYTSLCLITQICVTKLRSTVFNDFVPIVFTLNSRKLINFNYFI